MTSTIDGSNTLGGMVQRRTPGLSTKFLVERFVQIAEIIAGNPFYPYQKEFAERIIESVLERQGELITALFCRQGGKTQVVAGCAGALVMLMPHFSAQYPDDDRFCYLDPKNGNIKSYRDGFWVGIFAPKKEQSQIAFRRLQNFFKRHEVLELFAEVGVSFESFNGEEIRCSNGSRVRCFTASDQANIDGHTHHLGIMDESQDISDEKASKSIGPMLAATMGTLIKIGTANARKSHFYNSIRENERRHAMGADRNHFFVPWPIAAQYSTLYEEFIKKEIQRYGERSDEFQMSYGCNFLLHRGQAIDEATFLSRCVTQGDFSRRRINAPRPHMHYAAGIDFGKIHDPTVVTVVEVDWDRPREILQGNDPELGAFTLEIYGKHVCDWLELQGDDYESQYHQIKAFLRPWSIERLSLDYTGVGQAIGDRIKVLFDHAEVDLVPFSDDSKDEMGRMFLADVATGRVTWPGGPELQTDRLFLSFKAQLLDWEKEYKNSLLVLKHADVRGAHDDYAWSLALAMRAASKKPFGGEAEQTTYVL